MRPLVRPLLPLAFATLLISCGGSNDTPDATPAPTPSPSCTANSSPVAPAAPQVVTVSGGSVSGIDINVAAPASCSQINAELLGVMNIGQGGSATSNGGSVRRGESKRVVIFGRGMSGSLQVAIGGPQDIVVRDRSSITSQNGTPGISFHIDVNPAAALGARSVTLRDASHDITTFTGGLEVLP